MNRIQFNLYTAHYTDNDETRLVAHAMVVDQEGVLKIRRQHSDTMSYMDIRLDALVQFFERVKQVVANGFIGDVPTIDVTIHGCNSNFNQLAAKIGKVYRDLKTFEEDVSDVLELKLRRANRSKYTHHDLQFKLVSLMLQINRTAQLDVKFKPCSSKLSHMGVALQAAQAHLIKCQAATNIVPFKVVQ